VFESGRHTMASVEREPITGGGLRAEPQRDPRAEPLVRGQGAKPPEANTFRFWTFNESGKFAHFSEKWK